ncbi:serine/threonine-protein kinase [Pseudomonas sp. SZMC_28357]|uniref:serine/threonine-protein kinase n=1 Tax=Pseudomonas sp. SZMC_28357 TaxID=3074380 RepID=UPI002871CCB7|nr:serine/threonine-protein kinase [Pseudomonas sp. SZMC_28357]MDR9751372.1 serine/threonine-protein kinase [Pseudomonas sp. SZMC_28357]
MLEQLGKYRIDSVLGKGAMGTVYKAFDPHIARVVALKTIRLELLGDDQHEQLIGRFKNEAQAAGRLSHPNIVAVYDYGEDAGAAYIAMEFVDGTPLNTLLQTHPPRRLALALGWMRQLLQALEYAHSRGVVHRDVKPANLMITAEQHLKVADFGVARLDTSSLTQTGSMIGTPSYMSPEQFCGTLVDGRSDVFSAGIVLYQLLTGERPFSGSATMVMQQILNQTPLPPSSLNPTLDPLLDAVIVKALAKRPDDRYASAQQFLDALQAVDAELPVPQEIDDDATRLINPRQSGFGLTLATSRTAQSSAVESSASGALDTLSPWKHQARPELEALLSHQIGPLARLLVKRTLLVADDFDAVCSGLLPHIPSERGREQFSQATAALAQRLNLTEPPPTVEQTRPATLIQPPSEPEPISDSDSGYDPAFASLAEQHLTRLIGPIARIVVSRASRATDRKPVFLELLAEHINDPPVRAQFLRLLHSLGTAS